jgi:putative copper export protein/putative cell wall-binding protein
MFYVTAISEFLLYLCFSLLMGYFILQVIPESKRPEVVFPRWLLILCILGINVFSFTPVLQLVLFLTSSTSIGLALKTVLFTYEVGKSWLLLATLGLFLFISHLVMKIEKKTSMTFLSIAYLWFIISIIGWGSHANSIVPIKGHLYHSIHFLTITIWTGVLLQVAWFSKEVKNWGGFLKWFTPVALVCVLLAMGSGFMIMKIGMDPKDYVRSWGLSYGQALLIKHLFIIPLIVFAFMNGFLIKKSINPLENATTLSWLRAESLFVFIIFAVTGFLGQEAPPHSIEETLVAEGPSKLFEWMYSGIIYPTMNIRLNFNPSNLLLILLSSFILGMSIIRYKKTASSKLAVIAGIVLALSWYLSFMNSIQDANTLSFQDYEYENSDAEIQQTTSVTNTQQGRSARPPTELNPNAAENRMTINSKNITRIDSNDPIKTAVLVSQTVFPATHNGNQPGTVILVPLEKWQLGLASAKLTHHPNNGPLLFYTKDGIPTETLAEMKRLNPIGNLQGTQVLVMGEMPETVKSSLDGFTYESINGGHFAEFAANVDEYHARLSGEGAPKYSKDVIIVSSDEEAKLFSLPAINWNAHLTEPVLFVSKNEVTEETIKAIQRRENPTIFLLGPESVISDSVKVQLENYGRVTRISGEDPVSHSIAFAQYRDEQSSFGWGVTKPGRRLSFVSTESPELAIAAAPFAHLGKHAPLLWLEKEGLSMQFYEFLYTIQPFPDSANNGPYNHGYIIGTENEISFTIQGILDEKLDLFHEGLAGSGGH